MRDGDDDAFEELYRRYQRRIRNFVASRVGDPGRAEDVTQEAFLSALRGLRASDAEIAWKPWLYEIARNATIDFHRRRRNNEELSVDREELMRPLDRRRLVSSRAPETELDVKERLDHLRGAFDELPPNHHRVLVMREFEGLSYREIAERLNLTHAAVESKLFRARRRLKHEYEELAAGRRCSAVRATIALMAEGIEPRQERRQVARHARRCSACRRHARELGVDPFGRRPWQSRVAAFLPLGWLLRRSPAGPSRQGETLLGNGGHVGAGLAEQGVALVTAVALACAGSLALKLRLPADARRSSAVWPLPATPAAPGRVKWGQPEQGSAAAAAQRPSPPRAGVSIGLPARGSTTKKGPQPRFRRLRRKPRPSKPRLRGAGICGRGSSSEAAEPAPAGQVCGVPCRSKRPRPRGWTSTCLRTPARAGLRARCEDLVTKEPPGNLRPMAAEREPGEGDFPEVAHGLQPLLDGGPTSPDEHPDLVDEVIAESEAIERAGLRAYADQNDMTVEACFETLLTGLAVCATTTP